jgi:hypothetical protein
MATSVAKDNTAKKNTGSVKAVSDSLPKECRLELIGQRGQFEIVRTKRLHATHTDKTS